MASGFPTDSRNKCEGCQSYGKAHVSYRMEVRQQLCDECAKLQGHLIKEDNERHWCCAKHPQEIAKVFCITHDVFVCEPCSSTEHGKGCTLQDTVDTMEVRKEELNFLVEEGRKREGEMLKRSRIIKDQVVKIKEHYAQEERRLKKAYGDEIKKVTDRFGVLMRELREGSIIVREKVDKQIEGAEKICKDMSEIHTKAEKLMNNDELSASEFTKFTQQCCCMFEGDIDINVSDHALKIAEMVKFEREEGWKIGQIKMPVERWELERTFRAGQKGISCMIGSCSNNDVVIKNNYDSSIRLLNFQDGRGKKVIESKNSHGLWKCSFLEDGRIVGGSCDGDVVIFDHTWKHIKTISVVLSPSARVSVSVDDNGNVLASALGQSMIYIINPDKGEVVGSLNISNKAIYEVQAIGNKIAIRTRCSKGQDVCVLGSDGVVIATVHLHSKDMRSMIVDSSGDALYVMYQASPLTCAIDVMPFGRAAGARKIVDCSSTPLSPSFVLAGPSQIVLHNDGKVLIYKKTDHGLSEILNDSSSS
ncbi:uncharacterized protein LOC129258572 [Lytechinus pictus]|uniref:uncharacterized protein LOC129258572 n=1 Tax=Lytechinus pictus TaxID=7653 RepID=UPI0030BA2356